MIEGCRYLPKCRYLLKVMTALFLYVVSCRLHEEVEDNSAESEAVKAVKTPPPGKKKAVKGKKKTREKDVAQEVRAFNMKYDDKCKQH